MDNYVLSLIKDDGNVTDITKFSSELEWRDNIETLGMELNVDVARNTDDKYMKNHDIVNIGNKLILSNNGKELFRGIIVDLGTSQFRKSITAFDFAFYLNKSRTIVQFNKVKANEAITQLCDKFNVPIGNVTSISTLTTKIYKDDTIADIIKDILSIATKELGIEYRLEMREGKLFIEKYTDLVVKPKFKPAPNIAKISVMDAIGGISKTESISGMKNSILISSEDEKSSRILTAVKDSDNISKFGLLEEVESVDDKDIAQAKNIANNMLKELNRVGQDISIGPLLGDDDVRAGRILEINNDMFGLKGQYLVKECTHTYQNSIHRMSVSVREVI